MSDNISTTREDVDITVTESLNNKKTLDSIENYLALILAYTKKISWLKAYEHRSEDLDGDSVPAPFGPGGLSESLSRIEHTLNEMMLMKEQPSEFNISEAWEKQLRSAVITALRRHRNDPDSQIIIDTVVAIMKGHNED